MGSPGTVEADISARGLKVAIVAAKFNDFVVASLLKGAVNGWVEHGGAEEDVLVVRVPGAFEIPVLARKLALSGKYHAVVALGAIIRGDTPHFEYVAGECARGLQDVSLVTGVPVIFGVLTTDNVEQALQRASMTEANKGRESIVTALEMASLMAKL